MRFVLPDKRTYLQSSRTFRGLIIALSAILIVFGMIILTLANVSSLPKISIIPLVGKFFYPFSALAFTAYFVLEWRKEKQLKTRLVDNPDLQGVEINVIESLSEKILRWMVSIMAFIFVVVSLGFILICTYGIYEGTLKPHANRIILGELIVIGTAILVFVAWRLLFISRRKLLFGPVRTHSNNGD